jgi:hypothetical protein
MLDRISDRNRLTIGEGVETTLAARQLGLAPASERHKHSRRMLGVVADAAMMLTA